jgi:hypothetical protein
VRASGSTSIAFISERSIDGVTSDAMTAASDRDEQVPLAGEAYGRRHVVGAGAPGDDGRLVINDAVPDPARLDVTLFAGREERRETGCGAVRWRGGRVA